MDWWGWLILAVVILGALVGAAIAIQARRRRGGVLIEPPGSESAGTTESDA